MSVGAFAQNQVPARNFASSQTQVLQALQSLEAWKQAKLPTLDGFANIDEQQAQQCSGAYYQLVIDVEPNPGGGTVVRPTAKINAACNGGDTAHSANQAIKSNGRIEADLLACLDDYLNGKSASSVEESVLKELLAGLKAQRESLAQRRQELEKQLEIQREQQSAGGPPLAFITHDGAKVVTRNKPSARVLITAHSEDEFPIVEEASDWLRIEVGPGQTGWLRRSDARPEVEQGAAQEPEPATQDESFVVSRELVIPFTGEWKALQGKNALFVFAGEKTALPDGAQSELRLRYALSTFAQRYRRSGAGTSNFSGIVVVFSDGIAAATVSDIGRWVHGDVSKAAFLKRCSLDPLSAFNGVAKTGQ
jgi:hypothetical protein